MKPVKVCNWILMISASALIAACGNYPQYGVSSSDYSLATGVGTTTSGGGLDSSTQGRYNCPALDVNNVTPANFTSFNTGNFRACTDPASEADVLIDGTETNSDQICVFPAQSTQTGTDQEVIYWKPDVNESGAPWYSCQPASASGSIFTFQGVTWNAAYIVDGKDATQMQTCLIYGPNTPLCPNLPNYSYGVFR